LKENIRQFNFEFHKEKEMVDLRKSMLLLIIVAAMTSVASAQINPALQCTANAGVPPIVRAEGVAEQVGDLVLNCNGGNPTAAGATVPQVNVQIFLNVNVTSRLLADPWSEALLLIDEPGAPRPSGPTPPQLVCGGPTAPLDANGTCPIVSTGNPAQTYDGTGGVLGPPYSARPNIFQGRQVGSNSLVWLGVPFDPPGTTFTRILRITNVRANANQLGVSGTLIPSQIQMLISVSGATSVPINNPQQVVAFVQDGMTFSLRDINGGTYDRGADDIYYQCYSANCGGFRVRYSENFATAFKTVGSANQSVPGSIYNTESMLTNSAWPSISGRGNLATAGRATQGTRVMAKFTNVPAGVRLFVTIGPLATSGGNNAGLVGTDSNGADLADFGTSFLTGSASSNFCSSPSAWTVREVALDAARSGYAVWEVTAHDPFQIGLLEFGVLVKYTAQTSQGLPALGTAVVNGTYAPLTTVFTASATAPAPRFVDNNPVNAFTIIRCETNLLWPYVTNQAGFDTGMVIANTSQDPFGTETQEGPCTIYYYGSTTGGGAAPAAQTTSSIAAGTQAVWTLSSGGNYGIAATPGFQGYVIARCLFQYAHGYAFISDVGASKLAQGYLALIMDYGGLNRTGQVSEVLGN
jgi:hypothetical protein